MPFLLKAINISGQVDCHMTETTVTTVNVERMNSRYTKGFKALLFSQLAN